MPGTEDGRTPRDDFVSPAMPSQPQGQYQPDSRFMSLSLDLILMVFDPLEAHDSIALSLTCKGLYQHLFADARARFKNTSREGKHKVQTMLEKNIPPDQIYCAFCSTFHTLDDDYRRTSCLENQDTTLSSFDGHMPGSGIWKLKYLDARSVMNAMLFKRPAADKSLESLGRESVETAHDDGWIHVWEAKVTRGELYMQTSSSYLRRQATSDNEMFTYSVCKHVHIHAHYPHIWADFNELGSFCPFLNGAGASGTCSTCCADWVLWMEWVEERKTSACTGWFVDIMSWHRLGSLRSPSDPIWTRCAGDYETPKTISLMGGWDQIIEQNVRPPQIGQGRLADADCHYGEVRWAWSQAEMPGCF